MYASGLLQTYIPTLILTCKRPQIELKTLLSSCQCKTQPYVINMFFADLYNECSAIVKIAHYTSCYRHPQTRSNMAVEVVITTYNISVIYSVSHVVALNISILICSTCREHAF